MATPDYHYRITDLTLNYISQFYYYLSAFNGALEQRWTENLLDLSKKKQALAAISIGRNLGGNAFEEDEYEDALKLLEKDSTKDFSRYMKALNHLQKCKAHDLDITKKTINIWHGMISGAGANEKLHYRKSKGTVPKGVWQHGIKRIIELEVKTGAEDINKTMAELENWYEKVSDLINPVLLGAVVHFKIAEIHPYDDANGRLAQFLEKAIMMKHGYKEFMYLAPEYYYYVNRFQYFQLLEETIVKKDMTEWIEFYAFGLLSTVKTAMKDILKISGGAVNIQKRVIVELTEKEQQIVEILGTKEQINAAEIGKMLGKSRQNTNVILNRLIDKSIVAAVGKGASRRYFLQIHKD